jgi:exosome complex RNA-binding protein Rrp4
MSTNEYMSHLKESFNQECFTSNNGFVVSKSSLKEGLEVIQIYSIGMEETLEHSTDTIEDRRHTLTHYLRKLQAVANVLSQGLDGIRILSCNE